MKKLIYGNHQAVIELSFLFDFLYYINNNKNKKIFKKFMEFIELML